MTLGLFMTQVTSNATSSGKIHFITKYFDARLGFLVRILLHDKPYVMNKQTRRIFCVLLSELLPCMVSFYRKLDSS